MKKLWEKWSTEGLRWPYLHDPVSKQPSVTLLFPYLTFIIAVISLILLHIWPSMLIATGMSIFMWAIATVFYMLRKLSKAKFDLESKSFELDNDEKQFTPINPDNLTNS